jgi:hypothetical protein
MGWVTAAQYAQGGEYNIKDDFTKGWEESVSGAVATDAGPDVRISVYRFDLMQLERLCGPTRDPGELASAVEALRTPMPFFTGKMTASQREELRIQDESTSGGVRNRIDKPVSSWGRGFEDARDAGGEYIPLDLPPNRKNKDAAGRPGTGNREWPLEAAIGALKDSAASPQRVMRMLVLFSLGISGTTSVPEDVAELALSLGIPVYPVLKHSKVTRLTPPGFWRRTGANDLFEIELGRLGKLTGGHSFIPSPDDNDGALVARTLRAILNSVRNEALSEYVVGFAPPAASGAPQKHNLEIKLTPKSGRQLTGGKRQAIY